MSKAYALHCIKIDTFDYNQLRKSMPWIFWPLSKIAVFQICRIDLLNSSTMHQFIWKQFLQRGNPEFVISDNDIQLLLQGRANFVQNGMFHTEQAKKMQMKTPRQSK